jgi:hypothetical protein
MALAQSSDKRHPRLNHEALALKWSRPDFKARAKAAKADRLIFALTAPTLEGGDRDEPDPDDPRWRNAANRYWNDF